MEPIKAGATVELEIEWRTKLPGGPGGRGHRMTQRFDSKLFQPTQWYPRVSVNTMTLRGWETSPYLGPSEFYNNFGKFDVSDHCPRWLDRKRHRTTSKSNEVLTETASDSVLATVLKFK
jgi:hypothetical protein